MPLNWLDVSTLSFNALLLLEQVQLSWFPGWLPEGPLSIALRANPAVDWYLRHKCPSLNAWLDKVMAQHDEIQPRSISEIRQAETEVLGSIVDLLVYVLDPQIYDNLPFMKWDPQELVSLVNFNQKTVIDVGSGTGKLALTAAQNDAAVVYAVEPVTNLRAFIKNKALALGLKNVFAVDGLITDLPFPDGFADVTMAGHVFGDDPEAEYLELVRTTCPGGMVILCPGNNDLENDRHKYLVAQGFQWDRFEEPVDGIKRKYWKQV